MTTCTHCGVLVATEHQERLGSVCECGSVQRAGYALPEAVGDLRKIIATCDDMANYGREHGIAISAEWDDVKDSTLRVLWWAEARHTDPDQRRLPARESITEGAKNQ